MLNPRERVEFSNWSKASVSKQSSQERFPPQELGVENEIHKEESASVKIRLQLDYFHSSFKKIFYSKANFGYIKLTNRSIEQRILGLKCLKKRLLSLPLINVIIIFWQGQATVEWAGLIAIFLPQSSTCWDDRYIPPCLVDRFLQGWRRSILPSVRWLWWFEWRWPSQAPIWIVSP